MGVVCYKLYLLFFQRQRAWCQVEVLYGEDHQTLTSQRTLQIVLARETAGNKHLSHGRSSSLLLHLRRRISEILEVGVVITSRKLITLCIWTPSWHRYARNISLVARRENLGGHWNAPCLSVHPSILPSFTPTVAFLSKKYSLQLHILHVWCMWIPWWKILAIAWLLFDC